MKKLQDFVANQLTIKIETYWNVNDGIRIPDYGRLCIKIETYWNVNKFDVPEGYDAFSLK